MKQCNYCKEIKPLSEFSIKRKHKNQVNTKCKECNKLYQKEHYVNNKAYYKVKAKEYRKEIKDLYRSLKEENAKICPICNLSLDYYKFDYHHVNEFEKIGNVSNLVRNSGKVKLLAEIDKCLLICVNCHREVHFKKWTEQDFINMGYWCNGSIDVFHTSDLGS